MREDRERLTLQGQRGEPAAAPFSGVGNV